MHGNPILRKIIFIIVRYKIPLGLVLRKYIYTVTQINPKKVNKNFVKKLFSSMKFTFVAGKILGLFEDFKNV